MTKMLNDIFTKVIGLHTKVDGLLKALERLSRDASDNSDNRRVYILNYSDPASSYIDAVYRKKDDAQARMFALYSEQIIKHLDDDNYSIYINTECTRVSVTFQGAPYAEYVLDEQEVL